MKLHLLAITGCILILSCQSESADEHSTESPETSAVQPQISQEEIHEIETAATERASEVASTPPESRRVHLGNVQGESTGYYDNGQLVKAELKLDTETGPEEDSFIFDDSGKLIFSTHRSLTRNFAGKDGNYVIEQKLAYDDHQKIVGSMIRHGNQVDDNLSLDHLDYQQDTPDLEAMNDKYLPRLEVCLKSLGQSSLLK